MYKNSTQTPHVVSSTQTSYFQAYCLAYSNTHSLYSRLHFWPLSGIITLLVFSFFLAFIPQIKSKEKIGAHFFFLPFRRVIDRKPLKTLRIERSIFLFDWCGVLFFFFFAFIAKWSSFKWNKSYSFTPANSLYVVFAPYWYICHFVCTWRKHQILSHITQVTQFALGGHFLQ